MTITRKKVVLLVDDEPDLREILRDEFEPSGFEILEAANGKAAFEIIQSQKVDAVVTDIRMSGGDGVELLERIQAVNPDTPVVIMITGFADIASSEAFRRGAKAVFCKPFDLKLLRRKLEELLA